MADDYVVARQLGTSDYPLLTPFLTVTSTRSEPASAVAGAELMFSDAPA